jgi:RND family efflux transporter MFP subunit
MVTMESTLKIWLFQQCRMLRGSMHAQLLTGALDKGPYDQALFWPDQQHDPALLERVTQAALRSKQAVIKTRNNTTEVTKEPLDALACPLFLDGKLFGVFSVEMTNRSQPMQQAAVQLIQSGAKWLETMLLLQGSTTREQLVNLVDLVATGLENKKFPVAAMEVANQLAARFACQRVCLGFKRYQRIHIEALSHSTKIDHHSSLIRTLREAMNEAMDQEMTLVYPLPTKNQTLVTRCHAQLAKEQQNANICTVPLIQNGQVIGALLLERGANKPFSAECTQQCEQIGLLIGPVLETRRREERPLPVKFFAAIHGWGRKLFGPRHVPLKTTVVLAVALLVWLSTAGGMFRISSEASLEAGTCQVIVAPQQGYIATAPVRAGDLVREGDLLATLDDRDLQLELRKWQSQRAQLLKEYRQALSGSDRSEVAILNAKRAQAEAQLQLVEQQLKRTTLVAPFSGLVVKGDLSQSLGSPIERGEVLYEVAPMNNYRVILKVDDRDIGLVAPDQKGQLKLSGLPNQAIDIIIKRLTPVATSGEGRNYFRVEAIMSNQSDLMRPGMEGVAKIEIGSKKLLWIWTRRLVEWLQLFTWNRLP